ncbi:Saccharopine dehydrogenase [Carbonactinospora thermoautotrophica]|uniref:Saccharopine dehydrogenase n=3 Tax=Carbonactinospora thermoautotrophica TaxID=1469144 RepID=A0A132MVM8_9ACTN|nr:Saccharopine dehydrogenase [Carbonactinospora thermoautotrophica]
MAGMAGRVIVFGATGYTGRLVVESLLAAGVRPTVAGRDPARVRELAERHRLAAATADAARPKTVRALVDEGDVLVSTVGPFTRYGEPAVEAAVDAGAHYVDSTGEADFVRRVFTEFGPRAERKGCALLTAFGYDFVPGNLAGALALREAGDAARRVDIGYFVTGGGRMSSGTRATIAINAGRGAAHLLADRQIRLLPFARRVRSFPVDHHRHPAGLVGGTEPYTLPRIAPGLTDVGVYLGWFGPATHLMRLASYATPLLTRAPGVATALRRVGDRALARTGEGPDEQERARTGTLVVAVAADERDRELATVRLTGANPYDLTGRLIAWAAAALAAGRVQAGGALGPVDAFGLDELVRAAQDAGLHRE